MVGHAVRLGLGDNELAAPELVKAWAAEHEISAPPVFWMVLDRWSRYIMYRRRTRAAILPEEVSTVTGQQDAITKNQPTIEKAGYGRLTEVSRVPFTLR
jgi:hypothetical protein